MLRSSGMETIEDLDGLPEFNSVRGLGHLLPVDVRFLEVLRARINNPVSHFAYCPTHVCVCVFLFMSGTQETAERRRQDQRASRQVYCH